MQRYIDADKFIEWLDAGHFRSANEVCLSENNVIRMIKSQPAADVVEVVRCKDCVNRVEFDTNKFHCKLTGYYCGETGYCSDAVSKQKKGGTGIIKVKDL